VTGTTRFLTKPRLRERAIQGSHPRHRSYQMEGLLKRKGHKLANLRRSLGAIETFGFSLSVTAPTLAMAFTTILTARSAGRAAPIAYLIGGAAVTLVALSFVAFGRQIAHAGSVYAYVGSVFGPRWGFVAGWALLLMYVTLLAGSTALAGNFGAAGLGHAGIAGPNIWLIVAIFSAFFAVWLTWRDMQLAARLMLVLEAVSVLAILLLAIVVLTRVPLSLLPFKPEPDRGWAGIGDGIVFAVLAFAGFEGATTLGEETKNPGRSIPKAVLGTVIAATLFYVLVSYAQIVGYGLDHVQALSQASAPLDELSTRFISGTFAGFLDFAAATSSLACAIGCLSAAARMLYALSRSGLAPSLAEVDVKHGTPARSIFVLGAVNLVCLLLWGVRSDATSYSGNIVMIGTLALILVYVSVTGAQAINACHDRRPAWWTIGSLGAVLLLWPLWNSLYPAPPWPGNVWPYVVAAWLALGALIVFLRPSAVRFEFMPPKPSGDLSRESEFPGHLPL
jgi:amino acid transporter